MNKEYTEKEKDNIRKLGKVLLEYYIACDKVKDAFVEKYLEYDDSFWIGDERGGILSFSDQFLDMNHLVQVLELNMTDDELFDWYYWQIDFAHEQKTPPLNLENFMRVYREDKTKIQGFEKDDNQTQIPHD
jgi:hypothetical protein